VPLAIFKNGLRIAILSWLALYESADYLVGDLHHRGGPLFSTIDFALLLFVVWLLRRGERRHTPLVETNAQGAVFDHCRS
jgi:hypothetical protein